MSQTLSILESIWSALRGPKSLIGHVREEGQGALPSAYAVTDFATASVAAAGLALAEWMGKQGSSVPEVMVDRRLSSFWFSKSIRPMGWQLPPQWDPIAGNYQAKDGFIRLHTNAAHHRAACLKVLACAGNAKAVSEAVSRWDADVLQESIVAAGGVAAKMLRQDEWMTHPQGQLIAQAPLASWDAKSGSLLRQLGASNRPLNGLRVLDLTRILAGPVATRFLAAYGADVLRIDPLDWDEPAVLPEVTVGKKRARLDLTREEDRKIFTQLLAEADVIVHGYRADALEKLGFGLIVRQSINPDLIDVALNAYGWSGPWANRRGFDTIVQMSTGLAAAETQQAQAHFPQQLPVQALDYGTGHMMAAAVIRALSEAQTGARSYIRFSLAQTAALLAAYPSTSCAGLSDETERDLHNGHEETYWGPAKRLKPPLKIEGALFGFSRPAGLLGIDPPAFGSN